MRIFRQPFEHFRGLSFDAVSELSGDDDAFATMGEDEPFGDEELKPISKVIPGPKGRGRNSVLKPRHYLWFRRADTCRR
jgi:hypothetical protein